MLEKFMQFAERFRELEGRYPSRLDWRGENLEHFRRKHGLHYPSERQVQKYTKSWGRFLAELGETPRSTQKTADIAIQHVQSRYKGVEVMPGRSGTIDVFIGDERCEVKGATIGKDELIRSPRWRFRLHHRDYSSLVDRLILVGLVQDVPVVEWSLDNVGMFLHADGRDTLAIPAKNPFQFLSYPLQMYEEWKADLTYDELVNLSGLEPL